MKDVLDSIELRMLRIVDYLRDRNILGESHVQNYVMSSVLLLGGFWACRESTLFSIHNWMESKTSFTRNYSVVL